MEVQATDTFYFCSDLCLCLCLYLYLYLHVLYVAHLCLSLCLSLCLKLGAKAGQCHVLVYTFVVVVINKQLIETDANIIAPNIGYTLELLF